MRPPEFRPGRWDPAREGVKNIGVRLGNWLTAEQGQVLWQTPDPNRVKGKRDRALFAVLLACGLRRHEAVKLKLADIQQREGHQAIVDMPGKGGRVRTVPFLIGLWCKKV